MDPGATTFKYNHHHHHHHHNHNHNHPPLHYITSSSSKTQQQQQQQQDHLSFPSYFKPQPPQNPDAEISIFDAHKYFGIEQQQHHQRKKQSFSSSHETLPRLSSASSDGGKTFRTRSFHATPTASSEASWNSQTGLLVNPPGSVKVKVSLSSHDQTNNNNNNMKRKKKKPSSSSSNNNKKWNFCCAGKKSVRVKEATTSASVHHHLGPTTASPSPARSSKSDKKSVAAAGPLPDIASPPPEKPDPPRQQRISASGRSFVVDGGSGGFSFPILKNPAQAAIGPPGGFKGMITKSIVSPLDEDPPRDSLEVYQPTTTTETETENINPTTRHHHFNNPPGSPVARVEMTTDDDLGSDASSDLFELESFSTQTSLYPLYRRRDSLDEAPMTNGRRFQYGRRSLDETPTPSVAATECYAPSEVSIDWSVTTAEGYERASVSASEAGFLRQEEEGGKRKGNGGGGGGGMLLMSCRHGKAVSVGPQPVKCTPAEGTQGYGVHVGGRPPRAVKSTTLGNDHSSRLSLAFAA